jgi:hypothetical protein
MRALWIVGVLLTLANSGANAAAATAPAKHAAASAKVAAGQTPLAKNPPGRSARPSHLRGLSSIITGSTSDMRPASYEVLAESGDAAKRVVAVRLERRVHEAELKRIAAEIRMSEASRAPKAVVMFYLPGMKVGHGIWAHVYFAPEPKVTVTGLTMADEERLVSDVRRDNRPLIGAWLTAAPAPVGKLTIYREKGRLFAEWGLRDGVRFAEEVTETALPEGGWRYDRRGGGGAGDLLLLSPSGTLDLVDRDGVVTGTQVINRPVPDAKGDARVADSKGGVTITTVGSATTTSAAGTVSMAPAKTAPVPPAKMKTQVEPDRAPELKGAEPKPGPPAPAKVRTSTDFDSVFGRN